MSGFMTHGALAGGTAAAKGGPRAMGTGSFGTGRDPLMRLYGQTDLFSRASNKYPGLTDRQKVLGLAFHGKGLKGPLGDMYDLPERRNDMKIHSFEKEYTPNTSPSREYVAPEYQGDYKSVLSDWDQPQQMGSTAGFEDPNQYFRGRLRIGQDPTVQGVKGATAKRRGGSGKARPSRAPTKTNQYADTAQGTGLHT
jgi:hypothetical protein